MTRVKHLNLNEMFLYEVLLDIFADICVERAAAQPHWDTYIIKYKLVPASAAPSCATVYSLNEFCI